MMSSQSEINIDNNSDLDKLRAEIIRLKSAINELTVLNDIAVASGKVMDLDKLLNLIVQKSIKAANAEQGSIILVSPNKDSELKTLIRREAKTGIMPNYKVGNYVTGWVLKNKEALIIEDLANDERFLASGQEKEEVHTVMGMPIWLKGDIIGVFILTNKKNNQKFNSNDLRLLSIISGQTAQLINNMKLLEEVIEKERLEQELKLARKIQLDLLPRRIPELQHIELSSYFKPTDSVGGDYYDYFNLGGNWFGIVMADVSGHGPSAALIMTMLKGIIHSIISQHLSLNEILNRLNKIICNIAPPETFITLVLLLFDFDNRILQIANAGHHPVLQYKINQKVVHSIKVGGCALNLSNKSNFSLKDITYEKNDVFLIYTDGIVEAENPEYQMFGIDRLINVFTSCDLKSSDQIISNIKSGLYDFTNGMKQSDDIALIAIKIK